jgi:hypothetical protein
MHEERQQEDQRYPQKLSHQQDLSVLAPFRRP